MPNLDYEEPRIEIIEDDTGKAPVKMVSSDVIGVVGTFEKGALNEKKYITSLDSLIKTFGKNKKGLTGCKSILAAMAQGAKNFIVVRVAGASVKEASLVIKDTTGKDSIKISGITPGTWGNDVQVAIANGTTQGTFKLLVFYDGKSESFDNLTLDNLETIESKNIIVSKCDAATSIPKPLTATSLVGGDDGANTTDNDYLGDIVAGKRTGLKLMETERVNMMLCAQQYSETIRNALITHCLNMNVRDGLRVACLNPPPKLEVEKVCELTKQYDSMRAILGYPWNELIDIQGEYIAPDGFYAGVLATISSAESPSNKIVKGIISQQIELVSGDIKNLTKNRICPIALDTGFRVLNGLNLASDSRWSQISIRRAFDEIESEIYESTKWVKSKNITPLLLQAVGEQIDAILQIKKDNEKIYDFKPTICDETNNSPESMEARILKTKIRIRPTYAADYIDHHVERYAGE